MATKQKVAELPQEERDALINEAKELKIRGVYDTFSVDTLKTKIAEAKGAQQTTAGAENEQKAENSEQKSVENEQTSGTSEQARQTMQAEPAPAAAATEENAKTNSAAETKIPEQPKVTKAKGSAYINQTNNAPQKTKLCHICRSKVINGKCSGCGFEFKK